MKVAFAQTAHFLKAPPSEVRVFLVYGPDDGLAKERAQELARRLVPDLKDPFAVCSLDGAQDVAQRLALEMTLSPFTGGRKLVRIAHATESVAGYLDAFLKNPPTCDSVLVLEAGDLGKKSKLRALCENAPSLAAALACYVEDGPARQKTIAAFLETHKLSASRDNVRLLADLLPPDRMAMRSELEKLALYVQGQTVLTPEDIRAVIAGAGGAEIDALIEAVADGAPARVSSLLDFLWEEQTSPVTLLRAIQRYFMRLHIARAAMDNKGLSAQAAVKALSPPVFWKNAEPMARHLGRWSSARIEARLAEILEVEAAFKRTGTPAETLCAHLLLTMAAKG